MRLNCVNIAEVDVFEPGGWHRRIYFAKIWCCASVCLQGLDQLKVRAIVYLLCVFSVAGAYQLRIKVQGCV